MPTLQAIVFDLDDTLYPEQDFVLSGFQAVADWAEADLGIPAYNGFVELRDLFEQGVRGDTFSRWLAMHDLADNGLVIRLVQVYREHVPQIKPFPGVRTLLQSLHCRYRLGLVSDGYLSVQKRKLAALDLVDYFDAVVFSDEWSREAWKPSTKPFQVVLERLGGVSPVDAVYVADNPKKDFFAPRHLGMSSVRICHSGGLYSALEPPSPMYAPDVTITSWKDLEEAIATLEVALR